jgi:hypothetical protein
VSAGPRLAVGSFMGIGAELTRYRRAAHRLDPAARHGLTQFTGFPRAWQAGPEQV